MEAYNARHVGSRIARWVKAGGRTVSWEKDVFMFSLNHKINVIVSVADDEPECCLLRIHIHQRGVEPQENCSNGLTKLSMRTFSSSVFENELGLCGHRQGHLDDVKYEVATHIGESPEALAAFVLETANVVHKYR